MRVLHHGELVAEIPNKALTADAPVYKRPVGMWTAPVPKDPPAWVLEELKKPRDYTADLKKLLASANICDKRWVFEQYDSMVQTNTVQGPGCEAGVMRIKGTGHPAMHTSPSLDTMMPGVIGFAPFGGDETDVIERAKPERGLAMGSGGEWALVLSRSEAGGDACGGGGGAEGGLYGGGAGVGYELSELWESGEAGDYGAAFGGDRWIAEACVALGTPVTGGNVSLYNETKGGGDLSRLR